MEELVDEGIGNINALRRLIAEKIGEHFNSGGAVVLPHYTLPGLAISTGRVLSEEDLDVQYLMRQAVKNGSIPNYLRSNPNPLRVFGLLEDQGYDTSFFVGSGELINYSKRTEGMAKDWTQSLSRLVTLVTGEKGFNPKISISKFSPKTAYRVISNNYKAALRRDERAAEEVINYFLAEFEKRAKIDCRTPVLEGLIDRFNGVLGQIRSGYVLQSEKIEARIWKRNVPECFYDNQRLSCCIFFPEGVERYSIPLMLMDPQTSMVEYWVEGADEFVGVSTLFAGKHKTVLMDTWEANEAIYSVLSNKQTRRFALDSVVLAVNRSIRGPPNDKTVLVYDCTYGRPLEFVDYVKGLSSTAHSIQYDRERHFEIVDTEGVALRNSRYDRLHHGSGAFKSKEMLGKIPVFAINVGMYIEEFIKGEGIKAAQ